MVTISNVLILKLYAYENLTRRGKGLLIIGFKN